MPSGPAWGCKKVSVTGNHADEDGNIMTEEVEVWHRDVVDCVCELLGNPLFKEYMAYTPVHTFKDKAGLHRLIDDMWTVDWWWETQVSTYIHMKCCTHESYTVAGQVTRESNHHTCNPCVRQDHFVPVQRRQVSMASLPLDWQY
jgi:hypothetical protein